MDVVAAPAKLTLGLQITNVRPDGYHEIDAEMVTLDLADELRIEVSHDVEISATGPFAPADGFGEDDLVAAALRHVGRRARVEVAKNIPPGAGLGGGSADAAAVLRWAGDDDVVGAARLGADVAFCLVGGRARVTGIGQFVEPLPFREHTFTLLTPPVHCSTPEIYRRWDEMGGPSDPSGNDLLPAAVSVRPELERYRRVLADATGREPRLAGSGSTWFVEGAFPGAGRVVARTVPSG